MRIWIFATIIALAGCSAQTAPKPTIDRSPEKQAQRQAIVQQATAQGYIKLLRKTMTGNPVYAVNAGFQNADKQTKQNIASVIYAIYFDGTNVADFVSLVDAKTGKDYAMYSPEFGLRLQ